MYQARAQSGCIDGIRLGAVAEGASWRVPAGPAAMLCLVLRGSCRVGAGSNSLELEESWAAVLAPLVSQEYRAGAAGATVAMVELDDCEGPVCRMSKRLEDSHSYYLISQMLVAHLDGAWRRSAAMVRAVSRHSGRVSKAHAAELDGALAPIVQFIHDDPLAQTSLEQLAEIARIHPMTLARRFRAHRGCSIGDFRQRVRAERAFYRVIKTPAALSELSLVCGFSDQSHMTRQFRRFFGTTPALLRKATRIDRGLHLAGRRASRMCRT